MQAARVSAPLPPGTVSGAPPSTLTDRCTQLPGTRRRGGSCGAETCPRGSTPAPRGLAGLCSGRIAVTGQRCPAASPADPLLCWSDRSTGASWSRSLRHTARAETPPERVRPSLKKKKKRRPEVEFSVGGPSPKYHRLESNENIDTGSVSLNYKSHDTRNYTIKRNHCFINILNILYLL